MPIFSRKSRQPEPVIHLRQSPASPLWDYVITVGDNVVVARTRFKSRAAALDSARARIATGINAYETWEQTL